MIELHERNVGDESSYLVSPDGDILIGSASESYGCRCDLTSNGAEAVALLLQVPARP